MTQAELIAAIKSELQVSDSFTAKLNKTYEHLKRSWASNSRAWKEMQFWQGKFSMLKDENNALRKENARLKKEVDRHESRDESMVTNDE